MTQIRTAPVPKSLIIGTFLFLFGVVFAVAPIPVLYRNVGILLAAYLAVSMGGLPFGYLTALLAPPIGLISGDYDWLVMLPIVLSGNLLAILGLEYAWRYPALLVSPILSIIPMYFVASVATSRLFAIDLPWGVLPSMWISLHALTALAGVLITIYFDRKRARLESD